VTEACFAVVLATIRHQALSDLDQDGSDGLFGSWAVPVTTQLYTHVSIQKLKAIHDATHPGAKLKPAASRAADVKTEAEHAALLQASSRATASPCGRIPSRRRSFASASCACTMRSATTPVQVVTVRAIGTKGGIRCASATSGGSRESRSRRRAMKTVEMTQATGELPSYADQVRLEPVVVTDRGKPVMALMSIENADLETVNLSTDPRFIALIERSRALYKPGTGIPLEEIKRKYAIKSKPKPARRSHKARWAGGRAAMKTIDVHT